MREIKFRAWDRDSKQWVFINDQNFLLGVDGSINHRPSTVLMQYTGLKDKNGKEIYEGDVVRRHWSGDKPEDREVIFIDGAFMWGGDKFRTGIDSNWAEIIGNIYESPELLTNPTT